jgi:hypothetical protein
MILPLELSSLLLRISRFPSLAPRPKALLRLVTGAPLATIPGAIWPIQVAGYLAIALEQLSTSLQQLLRSPIWIAVPLKQASVLVVLASLISSGKKDVRPSQPRFAPGSPRQVHHNAPLLASTGSERLRLHQVLQHPLPLPGTLILTMDITAA